MDHHYQVHVRRYFRVGAVGRGIYLMCDENHRHCGDVGRGVLGDELITMESVNN